MHYASDGVLETQRRYFGGFEYERVLNNTADTHPSRRRIGWIDQLTQFPMSEGRVVYNNDAFSYQYQLKDHLGNIRTSFTCETGAPVLTEENYYYPFGLSFPIKNAAITNQYLYNGKELENFNQLNWYDYGARFYDPQLGRWPVVDPKDQFFSPYTYCANNPINGIDPDGMGAELPDYGIDASGYITLFGPGEDHLGTDRIYADSYKYQEFSYMEFPTGTLDHVYSKTITVNHSRLGLITTQADGYEVSSSAQATIIFEFITKNCNAEWSLTKITKDDNRKNVLTTGHNPITEIGIKPIFKELYKGWTIEEHIHNHNLYPPSQLYQIMTPSPGDMGFAKGFPEASYFIYTPANNKYTGYFSGGVIYGAKR